MDPTNRTYVGLVQSRHIRQEINTFQSIASSQPSTSVEHPQIREGCQGMNHGNTYASQTLQVSVRNAHFMIQDAYGLLLHA